MSIVTVVHSMLKIGVVESQVTFVPRFTSYYLHRYLFMFIGLILYVLPRCQTTNATRRDSGNKLT